jgi:geranylgeranyl pyrophosphate synthase
MACELFGGRAEDALDEALGIELFHNFTLMHDDIMDAAPLRRGHAHRACEVERQHGDPKRRRTCW